MDKNIEITMLYDIYGKLLTLRQQEIFEEYYLYNLSLREIADNKQISYQAVRDSLKTSIHMLENFEEYVGMLKTVDTVEHAYQICKETKDLNQYREQLLKLLSLKSEDDQ